MRLLVCGSRTMTDRQVVFSVLDSLAGRMHIRVVIEGGQRLRDPVTGEIVGGADFFANQWAHARGIEIMTFPANWHVYGRAAGPIRNWDMVQTGRPNLVLAFPGGNGTWSMIRIARKVGIPLIALRRDQLDNLKFNPEI